MKYTEAKKLLPKFQTLLLETVSNIYEQKIVAIFVGFEDFELTMAMYPMGRDVDNFPKQSHDEDHYTICACLENRQIVSVKRLVELDNHLGLIPDVEPLDYMSRMEHGKTKAEDVYYTL